MAIGQISSLFEGLLEGTKESFLRNIESVLEEEFNLIKKPPLQRNKRHDCMIKYNWFMMSPFLEVYDLFIPLPNHTLFWRAFEIQKNGNLDYNPVEHYIKERRGEEAVKEDFDYPFSRMVEAALSSPLSLISFSRLIKKSGKQFKMEVLLPPLSAFKR